MRIENNPPSNENLQPDMPEGNLMMNRNVSEVPQADTETESERLNERVEDYPTININQASPNIIKEKAVHVEGYEDVKSFEPEEPEESEEEQEIENQESESKHEGEIMEGEEEEDHDTCSKFGNQKEEK